jgi:hypothetical protein
MKKEKDQLIGEVDNVTGRDPLQAKSYCSKPSCLIPCKE